jgi:pimeloyl-ACP methyl ester carboxylesterase
MSDGERRTATVTVLGRTLHELRGGVGRPLLYLHSAVGETGLWLPYLQALAERHELHAPAHPGFGKSEGIDEIRDIEDLVYHYLAYLDVMGWDAVDILGLSLGGWIGAEIAARYPDRVRRLVLVSSVGIWVPGTPIADIFVADLRFPQRMSDLLFYDQTCQPAVMLRAVLGAKQVPDEILTDILNGRAAAAKVGWNPLLHDPRLASLLGRVTAPTLCLWGAQDRIVPPIYGETFARLIPDAKLIVLDPCGHMVPLERPDAFAAAVTEFLGG